MTNVKSGILWILTIFAGLGFSWASAATPVEQVGEALRDHEGNAVEAKTLEGKKLVAYYFSASWCPPCHKFSPELVKLYNKSQANEADAQNIEIVLVSLDNNEPAQWKYMKDYKMPWKTLTWRSDEADSLVMKYNIRAIPSLVVEDAQGNEITRQGVREVYQNPNGILQQWLKKIKG